MRNAIKNFFKKDNKTRSLFFLGLFSVETAIFLPLGMYHLIRAPRLLIPMLAILAIGYLISAFRSVYSKISLKKVSKSAGSRLIMFLIVFAISLFLSFIRKQVLGIYFTSTQIAAIAIWFLLGVVIENVVTLIILLVIDTDKR